MNTLRCTFYFIVAAATTLTACETTDPPDDTTDGALNPLFSCVDQEFGVTKPLESDLYKPAEGGLVPPAQESYIVHTTQLFVPAEAEAEFFQLTGAVLAELSATPGLIAYSLAGDPGCGDYRTLAIWESQEAMYQFVLSPAHTDAMDNTVAVSETGRVTHWQATADEVNALSWDVAKEKISKVPAVAGY